VNSLLFESYCNLLINDRMSESELKELRRIEEKWLYTSGIYEDF
jgi:hypothetical protein